MEYGLNKVASEQFGNINLDRKPRSPLLKDLLSNLYEEEDLHSATALAGETGIWLLIWPFRYKANVQIPRVVH